MPQYIIHKNGVFNVFSTVVDAPLIEQGLPLEEFQDWFQLMQGADAMNKLPELLARARATGTSASSGTTLQELVAFNRAGPSETSLPLAEFERQYLTADAGIPGATSAPAAPQENPTQDHSGTAL